jgi:hypothetical protein
MTEQPSEKNLHQELKSMTALTASVLVEQGFLQPLKRGRPRVYPTSEEQAAAKRAQQKVCARRHAERVKEARALMKATLQETDGVKRTCSLADFVAREV